MIARRKYLRWLLCAALVVGAVGSACVAAANMIQSRHTVATTFNNGGQPWPFFNNVSAINYDTGGQGVGYNVPAPNTGGCLQTSSWRSDTVNFKTSSTGGAAIPFQIGCSSSPNSFNYTVNIPTSCQSSPFCQITLQLSDTSAGGKWNVLIDGAVVTTVSTPNTTSFDTFALSTSGPFSATPGTHKLTLAWAAGDANFQGVGDILTWQGSQAPPTAINSVSMDCGNSCSFVPGSPVGTVVGHAAAVMSTGSFAGTWSAKTSGSDNFGVSCVNQTGQFAINGSTGVVTVANASAPAGTYPGYCVTATQLGATGSPFTVAVTITGSSGMACNAGPAFTGTIPNAAQVAGFTTCMANYDFTDPFYQNMANWLDCKGASTPQWWNSPSWGNAAPCSSYNITTDTDGIKSLDITFQPSYFGLGTYATEMTTTNIVNSNPSTRIVIDYPQSIYVEVVARVTQGTIDSEAGHNPPNPDLADAWEWPNASGAIEWDFTEIFSNGFNLAGTIDNDAGGQFYGLPYGFQDWTKYHAYGTRITSNGSQFARCDYLDNVFVACIGPFTPGNSNSFNVRNYLRILSGVSHSDSPVPTQNMDYLVRSERIWTCPGGVTGECNGGPLLSSAP